MAKRLISLRELDDLEEVIERRYRLQERLEMLEGEAAQFDSPVQGAPELAQKASQLKQELAASLEVIFTRLKA